MLAAWQPMSKHSIQVTIALNFTGGHAAICSVLHTGLAVGTSNLAQHFVCTWRQLQGCHCLHEFLSCIIHVAQVML